MTTNRTLAWALALARAGIWVFPCRYHDKAPATRNGFWDATIDEAQIRRWWEANPNWNIAIRCGEQPNVDLNLVAIDIDAQSGGLETWALWLATHEVPETVRHETPSGGFHLFFNTDREFRPGVNQLGPGIDVRGTDSYVVAPPSVTPSKVTGELNPYQGHRESFIGNRHHVAWMPDDMHDALLASNGNGHVERPASRGLRLLDTGDSVADKAREGWIWADELEADGWTLHHVNGDESHWTRPDKDRRGGSSAVLHGDSGPLVTFSTALPTGGVAAAGAAIGSFSPWDYIVTFRCGGDTKAAAALVRGAGASAGRAVQAPTPTNGDDTSLSQLPTLPDEFWDHPFNAHVLAAARARRCGPDALMLNVLLRASILIPPQFLLPPLSGGRSPLNLLGCVVGRTGEGKSVSIAAAADVIGIEHPWLLWDMPLGSGEGVGDVFMMDEVEDTPKGKRRTGRRVQNPNLYAVHFTVDEGAALVEQSTRKGATIIPALCKAWTGVTLGETNADVATRRRVRALSYRVSAVVNIQPTNFHRLFNTLNTGTGLTGRFLFAPAADYAMPDERGEWPGTLDFPALHGSTFGNEVDYHPDIYAEVDAAIVTANRTGGTPENTSHANLLRARVAAIYALAEDRRTISPTDWYTAGLLVATSSELLFALDRQAAQIERVRRHRADEVKADSDYVVETAKERRHIAAMAERIRVKVEQEPWGRNKLAKELTSSTTRPRFDRALELAESNGWITVVDGRIEQA